MNKKVAWQINEDMECGSVVVFHHHGLAARREGANDLGLDFEDVECYRASQFDEYADKGEIPRTVLLDNGWWFECHSCYAHITEDSIYKYSPYYCSFKCWLKEKVRVLKLLFVPKQTGEIE